MNGLQNEIDNLIEGIKQQRDELKLQLHLGKTEVRDEWEKAEHKLEQIRSKADTVRHEMGDASEDVLAAIKITAEEIKKGYERIRKVL